MYHLSFEQFQELLINQGHQIEDEKQKEKLYHSTYSSEINTPICKGSAINISIREGIILIKTQLTFNQKTCIGMKSFLPQIGFGYCLKGRMKGYRKNTVVKEGSELYYELSARKGMIYATAASEGWMQLEELETYQAMYLLFSYETFKQLLGEQLEQMHGDFLRALNENNGFYLRFTRLSSQIIALADALFDNPYAGKSREFYREAKVIELLAYQVDELTKHHNEIDATGLKLTEKEDKVLEHCHQVLLSSLENPPSLIELAKEVGISDYRLKNGFRQKYGITPYRFVVDARMIKAKELLLAGKMTVSEVAWAVGFTSIGSFSNSFYEKFGIRPSEM